MRTKGRAWILHGEAEEEVLMRTKSASADKDKGMCSTERECRAVRGPYQSRLMKLFERGHGTCTVST
jgi:hypothetical protein